MPALRQPARDLLRLALHALVEPVPGQQRHAVRALSR